jgi:hypothetical protein
MTKITNDSNRTYYVRTLALSDNQSASFEFGWFLGVNNIEFETWYNETMKRQMYKITTKGDNTIEIGIIADKAFSINGTRFSYERMIKTLVNEDWM